MDIDDDKGSVGKCSEKSEETYNSSESLNLSHLSEQSESLRENISHVCVISHKNDEKVVLAVELSYIGQDCYAIPSILGKIYGSQTRRLDLSFNSLRILDGLEMFPLLEELIVDNNDLNDLTKFVPLPRLHTLSLNKNRFTDLDFLLKQLVKCYPKLTYLSLLGNQACPDQLSSLEKDEDDYKRYRYYILHELPNLRFLDSSPVKQLEILESRRIGSFMKIVKPKVELAQEASDETESSREYSPYSPLPPNNKKEGTHRGSFGKLKQRYTGTQSEGNRFIRDSEL